VMGCAFKRWEMVTHLPARFINWSLRSLFGKKIVLSSMKLRNV
jgi:hypothetical protein